VAAWDSSAVITLVNVIEDEFGIQVDFDLLADLDSFDRFHEYLRKKRESPDNQDASQFKISLLPGFSGCPSRSAMRPANRSGGNAPRRPAGVLVICVSIFSGRTMRVLMRGYCKGATRASASTACFAAT